MSFLRVKLSYSVKEVLSEDAVSDSVSWSEKNQSTQRKN